jgi:lysine 2,3-aminomutase
MAVEEAGDGCFRLRDFRGMTHVYPPEEGAV